MSKHLSRFQTIIWFAVTALLLGDGASAQTYSPPSAVGFTLVNSKDAKRLLERQQEPEYPPVAKFNYIQGSVRLELWVSQDGKITHEHAIQGHPILAAAVLESARNWLYHPLKIAGAARAFITFIDVNFTLHNADPRLLPPYPERDLARQVLQPAVLETPAGQQSGAPKQQARTIRLRVLVGPDGNAMDCAPVDLSAAADFAAAQNTLKQWRFRPARWGNELVAWYLDVDVPVNSGHDMHSSQG